MKKLLMPTLSSRGWLSTPELIIDEVLNNYLSANPSQTMLFSGNVVSLQYAVYKTNNNENLLANRVKSDLETMYNEYSDNIDVTVNHKTVDGKIKLFISGTVEINSKYYDINQVVSNMDSMFAKNNNAIRL